MAVVDNEKATVSCENNVFHILRRWLMQDFEERKPHLAKLIPLVRWSVMDRNFLLDVASRASWLKGCSQFQVPQQHRADVINTLLLFKPLSSCHMLAGAVRSGLSVDGSVFM